MLLFLGCDDNPVATNNCLITAGDVNGDNWTNVADIAIIVNNLLGGSNDFICSWTLDEYSICDEFDCINSADMDDDGEIGALDISLIVNSILGGRIPAENINIIHDINTNSINYEADGELDIFYLQLLIQEDTDFVFNCNNSGNYVINDNIVTMYILGFDSDCNELLNSTADFTIIEAKVAVSGYYINVNIID